MQVETKSDIVPDIGTGHDPLPGIVQCLEDLIHLKCAGITNFMEAVQKEARSLIADGSSAAASGTNSIEAATLDAARHMYKKFCTKDIAQVRYILSQ